MFLALRYVVIIASSSGIVMEILYAILGAFGIIQRYAGVV